MDRPGVVVRRFVVRVARLRGDQAHPTQPMVDASVHRERGAGEHARHRTLHEQRTLAIDFASVAARPTTIDFAVVDSSPVPVLDTLTDLEAEQALAESGYCVRILRVENRPLLVDCGTGGVAILR